MLNPDITILPTSYSEDGYKFNRSSGESPPESGDWQKIDSLLEKRDNFLEVGVAEGRSIIQTAKTLMRDGTAIHCVDSWESPEEGEDNFDYNLAILNKNYPNNTFIKTKNEGKKELVSLLYREFSFDFIYIDAGKLGRHVSQYFAFAYELLSPNGILMFDDYYFDRETDPLRDSKLALNAMMFFFQNKIRIIHRGKRCIIQKLKETT